MAEESTNQESSKGGSSKSGPQGESSFFGKLFGALVLSLFASIVLEWIGIGFFWPEEGHLHSAAMVQKELGYLNQDFRKGLFDSSPAELIEGLASQAYFYAFQFTYIEDAIVWMGDAVGLDDYASAAVNCIQVFLLRLGILSFSLPIYVLFAVVGASTGLSMRDIRRWSGGREYGRVYHQAKSMAPKVLILAWFIYLSVPESIHPNFVILPCAVLFGLNVLIVTATYKKYM